jgi:hypothetical protein
MSGFRARREVTASFGGISLGVAADLDIGSFEDPTQHGDQYYVWQRERRQDVVRFAVAVDARDLLGRVAHLELRAPDGSAYRVEAACVGAEDGALTFEALVDPCITRPAIDRHGVDDLAAALLLDALKE